MLPNYGGHVFHATVTDLDTSLTEDLVQLMHPGEIPVKQVEESSGDVGADILPKWRIKTCNLVACLPFLLLLIVRVDG